MSDLQKFKEVIGVPYKDQAIFSCPEKKAAGNDLDEFNAHRFLEFWQETATVIRLRELLRELGLDRKKRMSLIEYLVVKYRVTIRELIARPQGTNVELARAQQALQAAQDEINKIETRKAQLEAAANGTGIKAMQAKNELAQLLSADPTDLNRALLTAEAAVRKAQKLGGDAQGALWWIDRELTEMKKYKPQKSGGTAK